MLRLVCGRSPAAGQTLGSAGWGRGSRAYGWAMGCFCGRSRQRVGRHGGETRLCKCLGTYHKNVRSQRVCRNVRSGSRGRLCAGVGCGLERAANGAGLCGQFPENGRAASEEGACKARERGGVADLEGGLRVGACSAGACWPVEHVGVFCSWCSIPHPVRERADGFLLWRISAFCLTGLGERPRVPTDFLWHP